jgi:hypothetical protein
LRVFADSVCIDCLHAPFEMVARAVEDADRRLHDLRREEFEDGAAAVAVFALAVVASRVRPEFALPFLVASLFVLGRTVLAVWRHWDLLDRLLGERDAYSIPEVRKRAEQEAEMASRRRLSRAIRSRLELAENPRVVANADQFAMLAEELADPLLALDPACAVMCSRLLTDSVESPLNNPGLPAEDVRSRLTQVRCGFRVPN